MASAVPRERSLGVRLTRTTRPPLRPCRAIPSAPSLTRVLRTVGANRRCRCSRDAFRAASLQCLRTGAATVTGGVRLATSDTSLRRRRCSSVAPTGVTASRPRPPSGVGSTSRAPPSPASSAPPSVRRLSPGCGLRLKIASRRFSGGALFRRYQRIGAVSLRPRGSCLDRHLAHRCKQRPARNDVSHQHVSCCRTDRSACSSTLGGWGRRLAFFDRGARV